MLFRSAPGGATNSAANYCAQHQSVTDADTGIHNRECGAGAARAHGYERGAGGDRYRADGVYHYTNTDYEHNTDHVGYLAHGRHHDYNNDHDHDHDSGHGGCPGYDHYHDNDQHRRWWQHDKQQHDKQYFERRRSEEWRKAEASCNHHQAGREDCADQGQAPGLPLGTIAG